MTENHQNAIRGFHLVRYGTAADQRFLLKPFLKTYDQLVINANMVAHMPGALASFLMQRANNKDYFIDPQTHAFQHDISHLESTSGKTAGKIKRSILSLLESYGEPVKSVIEKDQRSILPQDFTRKAIFEGYCERVIEFQRRRIYHEANQSEVAKYYKYLEKKSKIPKAEFGPTLVVPPYFFMTSNTYDKWIDLNVRAIELSKSIATDIPVAAQIVISKDLLTTPSLSDELVKKYGATEPSVFLIWIDAFSEQRVNSNELHMFIKLINNLGEHAPVVNLYGGFLSIALKRCNVTEPLIGVCHGLEYGEHRSVVPVGGGVPIAKFYHPVIHKRLKFREAYRAIRKEGGMQSVSDFQKLVCDCPECKSLIRNDPEEDFDVYGRSRPLSFIRKNQPIAMEYPLPETKDHCVRHYMWCKQREYGHAVSKASIRRDLERSENLVGTLGLEDIAYVSIWKGVLSDRAPRI